MKDSENLCKRARPPKPHNEMNHHQKQKQKDQKRLLKCFERCSSWIVLHLKKTFYVQKGDEDVMIQLVRLVSPTVGRCYRLKTKRKLKDSGGEKIDEQTDLN